MNLQACAGLVLLVASAAVAAEPKNLLKPTNQVASWRFEQHEGGKGMIAAEGDAIVFVVTEVDGTDWHVQGLQTDLNLVEGTDYVVRFHIKASEPRSVTVLAMIDQDDWHTIGLAEQVFVDRDYKELEYVFRAENVVANKNRLGFALGEAKGTVTIKGLTLTAK